MKRIPTAASAGMFTHLSFHKNTLSHVIILLSIHDLQHFLVIMAQSDAQPLKILYRR